MLQRFHAMIPSKPVRYNTVELFSGGGSAGSNPAGGTALQVPYSGSTARYRYYATIAR